MGLDVMQYDPQIEKRVKEIIAEQTMLDPAEIRLEDDLVALGLDSLGLVECIFGIEESFGISIPFNANTPGEPGFDMSCVGAIIAEVEKLVARQPA